MENAKKLSDVIEIKYITSENASFARENGFLTMDSEGTHYPRVQFHRAFPFEMEEQYISVLDDERQEIALIRDITTDFQGEQAELIREELTKKYYTAKVLRITGMKDNFGFMQVTVESDIGTLSFGVRDIYRNLIKAGNGRIFIVDVDGNRYEIPDYRKLDKSSYKKLELYL